MPKEFYSVLECSKIYRVSVSTVRDRWIADGELRAVNVNAPGKRPKWRIHRDDLERFRTLRSNIKTPARRKPRAGDTVKEYV